MRAKTLVGFAILCLAAIIFAPTITNGQGGKKPGGGGGGYDAGASFDRRANGRPSIPISEFQYFREQLQQYAQEKGITNGMVTRQQYVEYAEQLGAKIRSGAVTMKGGPGGGMKGPRNPGADSGTPPKGPAPASPTAKPNMDYLKELSDKEFLRMDRNGDGKLSPDEMPETLRNKLAKYDKNGDGLIDMYEFRAYMIDRLTDNPNPQPGKEGNTGGVTTIIIEDEELDRKPVVFRAGVKMPSGLPAWFNDLQVDGQVPLYAWRKKGKDLEEFKRWDLNDDGFITPDEALKQQAALAKGDSTTLASNGGNGTKIGADNTGSGDRSKWGGGGGKKMGWPFGGGYGKKTP